MTNTTHKESISTREARGARTTKHMPLILFASSVLAIVGLAIAFGFVNM